MTQTNEIDAALDALKDHLWAQEFSDDENYRNNAFQKLKESQHYIFKALQSQSNAGTVKDSLTVDTIKIDRGDVPEGLSLQLFRFKESNQINGEFEHNMDKTIYKTAALIAAEMDGE